MGCCYASRAALRQSRSRLAIASGAGFTYAEINDICSCMPRCLAAGTGRRRRLLLFTLNIRYSLLIIIIQVYQLQKQVNDKAVALIEHYLQTHYHGKAPYEEWTNVLIDIVRNRNLEYISQYMR